MIKILLPAAVVAVARVFVLLVLVLLPYKNGRWNSNSYILAEAFLVYKYDYKATAGATTTSKMRSQLKCSSGRNDMGSLLSYFWRINTKARFTRNKRCNIHSTSVLYLNRFLFDMNELDTSIQDSNIDALKSTTPTVTLAREDYRTIHAAKILKLHNNDTLRAGIVLDRQEEQQSTTLAGTTTDKGTIQWLPEGKNKLAQPTKNGEPPGSLQIVLHGLHKAVNNDIISDNKNNPQVDDKTRSNIDIPPKISLLLALPRPLQLERLLPMISQMGVDHLILCNAQKVPKDYFGSHLFRSDVFQQPQTCIIRQKLVEGLCQAGDVILPKVTLIKRLKPFLQDGQFDALFPLDTYARVIAHPTRKDDATTPELRMRNVQFLDNTNQKNIVLAVGPEGGWSEPYELDLFTKQHNFQQITLGTRVLRSDVAVISLLSLAHDVCTSP